MIELKGKHNNCKVFTDNIDNAAVGQLTALLNQESVAGSKIRIMPDVHAGVGCTIGTTMTLIDKVVPNLVGVDIGCGMLCINLKLNKKDIDLNNLRKNIAVVFQDNFLFGGTIRENIIFNRKDVSEEQLNKAIKSACLEEFINSLDNGLDTQIGERGVMLSGGQKQRIAIARAFIKNAPILILDEATSALDNKSEAVVQQAIDNLMKDRSVLVIAHRLSTIRNADYLAVVNNGRIVERGSHKKLLANEGEYAALYKTQLV